MEKELTKEELLERDSIEEKVYNCKYCHATHDEDSAIVHSALCKANFHEQSNCLTCENCILKRVSIEEVEKYPSYFVDEAREIAYFTNRKFYCDNKKKVLLDEDFKSEKECYIKRYTSTYDVVDTEDYEKQTRDMYAELAKDESNFIDEEAKQKYFEQLEKS